MKREDVREKIRNAIKNKWNDDDYKNSQMYNKKNIKPVCQFDSDMNLIAEFAVASNSTKNNSKYVSISHEYIVCYARNKSSLTDEWKVKKNNS